MANITVKLNGAGVRELLRSQEMLDACLDQANSIAAQAGDGYEVDTIMYPERACARVKAETRKAVIDAYENNTLLYLIGG